MADNSHECEVSQCVGPVSDTRGDPPPNPYQSLTLRFASIRMLRELAAFMTQRAGRKVSMSTAVIRASTITYAYYRHLDEKAAQANGGK